MQQIVMRPEASFDAEAELARAREELDLLRARLAGRDDVLRRALEEQARALLEQLVRAHESSSREAEASRHDSLTGLVRHGVFRARLAFECERSDRTGDPLGLVLVDIDRFAAFNEVCGYAEGDRALQQIGLGLRSLCLTEQTRRPLVVAREGGARFGVIIPAGGADESAARADAIRTWIAQLPLRHRLTARAGVVSWSRGCDGDVLVEEAGRALDHARDEGGNRVIVAESMTRAGG